MRLSNKVALVTGAASGQGRVVAQTFAREQARVVVLDVNHHGGEETAALIREAGGEGVFVPADVARAEDLERAVQLTLRSYGRLDILYNTAGGGLMKTLTETTEAEWDAAMDVNLKGVYHGCKAALPAMIASGGGGSIINVASTVGLSGTIAHAAYAAAKAGVINLTKSIALEYGSYKIRCNAICPGPIDTPMFRGTIERAEDPEVDLRRVIGDRPLGRIGTTQDIAYAALFLASDESAWISGIVLPVDGGRAARRGGG
jgi:NAD(P)-dependent dehydrogenase (short-subunit alcohol dehydrogenase family)